MNLRTLARVAFVIAAFAPASATFAQAQDFSPAFSADGKVLAWLHSEDGKAALCISVEPFEKIASATALDNEAANALRQRGNYGRFGQLVALSGDGTNVFVAADKVWHFTVVDGVPSGAQSVAAKASWLSASEDGKALAMLLDGPQANTYVDSIRGSPSWQSLATASLRDGKWRVGEPVTPAQEGKFAARPMLSPDGKSVIYSYDKKNLQAGVGGTDPKEIRFPGFSFHPCSLSADGNTMLVTGRDITDDQSVSNKNIFVLRKEDSAWQKPELVQRDPAIKNTDNVVMSSDARLIVYENHSAAAKGGSEDGKTQLLSIGQSAGEWDQPSVIFEQEGAVTFAGIAVGKGKQVACAVQSGRGGQCQLFLRAYPKADSSSTNLSDMAKKAQTRAMPTAPIAGTSTRTTSAPTKD